MSTDRACTLRDVGEDPSPDTPRAAPSVRRALGARHLTYPATVLINVARIPVSLRRACGAAAEGCVTITVHVATCSRCSLLAASDPLSRSLSGGVSPYSLNSRPERVEPNVFVVARFCRDCAGQCMVHGKSLTESMFYMASPPLVNTIGCRLVAVPTLHCKDSTTGAALLRCSHGGGRGAQNNFAPTLVLLRQIVHRSSGDLKTVFYMASPPCEHSNKTAPGMMPHCVLLPSHCTPILENPKRGTTESTHHSGRSSRRRWLVLTSLPTPNRPAAAP